MKIVLHKISFTFLSVIALFAVKLFFVPIAHGASDVSLFFEPSHFAEKPDKLFSAKLFLKTPSTGYNITSFDLEILFDPKIVEVDSIQQTPIFKTVSTFYTPSEGKIHMVRVNTEDKLSGKLPLATITFKGLIEGGSDIKFENVKVYDLSKTDPIAVEVKNSTIVVSNTATGASGGDGNSTGGVNPRPTNTPECFIDGVEGTNTELGCIPNDPIAFIQKFYAIGLGLIGGVATLFIIYSGYILTTSQGNSVAIAKARSYLYYSIAGLILAIFGFVFFEFIATDILHLPGFG